MAETSAFKALVVRKVDDQISASVEEMTLEDLPDLVVTVQIDFSTINYKDGLAIKGLGGIAKAWPHIPGIDLAGTVLASRSPDFAPGDRVVTTSLKASEAAWGGFSQVARMDGGWLTRLPDQISNRQAMAIGTAGFTAMMALQALEEQGLKPENEGQVLITGAAGGVGSVAVALLSTLGFRVAASTGRPETHDYLRDLGAAAIIDRSELEVPPDKPLGPERWAGVIDCVGGTILANALASLRRRRGCAAVGLAASPNLETSVLPFLLRGINLLGIDSTNCPVDLRLNAWKRLSTEMAKDKLDYMTNVIPLAGVIGEGGKILQGRIRGRTVVDLGG